jgi:NTP pyrophosphatase (non-canonical NTP hydrolase)
MKELDKIAYDWGLRCFGYDHMKNLQIRTLRMIEEAIEVGQAVDLTEKLLLKQVAEVYKRPPGELKKELGGLYNTFRILCTCLGVDAEEILLTEIRRCLEMSPKHFAKRNTDKLSLGLDV